jgi:predicted aspartyl protease
MIAIALFSLLAAGPLAPTGSTCGAPAPAVSYPIHVPIEVASNHVYVKVCVGDRELQFLLDTGAGQSFFDMGVARSTGVQLGAHFTGHGAGAGTIDGAVVVNGAITLQGTRISVPLPAALDLSGLPPREGHVIDGILGFNFIDQYVVAIDYVKQELRLFDAARFAYSGPGTSLPITFAANHPVVETSLRLANGDTMSGRFVVDVGAASALALTRPFVEANRLRTRITPTVHRIAGGGVGGTVVTDVGRVATLKLGALEVHNVITSLYGDSAGVMSGNGSWIGNIGGDVLRRFTVFLDYRRHRIILEPHRSTNEPFEADMSGVTFTLPDSPGRIVVSDVLRDSPAAAAGLAAGDTVIAIDGVAPNEVRLRDLRERLNHEGVAVELTFVRGGQTKTARLRTRRLI